MLGTGLSLALLFAVSCKNEIQPDASSTNAAARIGVASTASCATPTSQLITLPTGLKDQDFNFVDQDGVAAGTQINADASLINNDRQLQVTSTNTTGAVADLGKFLINGPDGSFLKFKIKNTISVGSGVHVLLEVTFNSLSTYTGNNSGKKAFRDDPNNQVGKAFLVSLEFYDALGNPGGPYTGTNNLPSLRDMYKVGDAFSSTSWITLPTGLRDQDYSFVDQSASIPGMQIGTEVNLLPVSNIANRELQVSVAAGSKNGGAANELIGFYRKNGPDGSYLTFSISEVRKVGSGIQVLLNVTGNSLSTYTGDNLNKKAFRDNNPVGMKIITSLEFYDAAGNPGGPYTGTNNLPGLRDMYEVGTCQ
ncbi:hypothetical protein DYU11_04430 [Fibrisoma montanum]|uniref:Uncharacterized protein n=2 Tax=Fibrisoma montanum TaxID=2305895 RepID=A0A418MJI4_9BACT|nr:hypothetical protein DYU11_04430 [Fibrisoma montanum]